MVAVVIRMIGTSMVSGRMPPAGSTFGSSSIDMAAMRGGAYDFIEKPFASGRLLDMSPGEQLIDIVHIDDVVDAYVMAAASNPYRPYRARATCLASKGRWESTLTTST